ncbi:MAG: hypothetical protein LAT50_19165, partial [Ectothiorhodospiraceae bacterium]|nr:hypothetical protein [Ectothiorhodospiraceae bacterium]
PRGAPGRPAGPRPPPAPRPGAGAGPPPPPPNPGGAGGPPPPTAPGGAGTIMRFLLLVGVIFAAAVAVELSLDIPLPLAILLTAPVAAFAWLTVQRRRRGLPQAIALTVGRLLKRSDVQFSGMRAEVSVLCAAGLIGTLVAQAVPTTAFADALGLIGVQGAVVGVVLMLLIVLLAQIGLNPILVVTVGLSSLSQPELFGLSPELLALSAMCGWTLAVGCSPVTTSILIASRMAGVSPQTAGWRWNGRYTVVATLLMVVWLFGLSWLLF